jgi:hypothetical protein
MLQGILPPVDILQKNLPTKRRDAIALGVTRYFTGKPCKSGHLCERHLTNGCIECRKVAKKAYYKTPQGMEKRRAIKRRSDRTPAGKARRRRQKKRWNLTPAGKESQRMRNLRNKALGRDRKSTWYGRTPKWADKKAITEFVMAKPPGYHLDHILPIRGETVCGLHILENLQYLPAEENWKKSNSVIPITLEAAVCPLPEIISGNPV